MTLKNRILTALEESPDTRVALSAVCAGPAKSTAAALSVLMREGKVRRIGERPHPGDRRGRAEIIYALKSNAVLSRGEAVGLNNLLGEDKP